MTTPHQIKMKIKKMFTHWRMYLNALLLMWKHDRCDVIRSLLFHRSSRPFPHALCPPFTMCPRKKQNRNILSRCEWSCRLNLHDLLTVTNDVFFFQTQCIFGYVRNFSYLIFYLSCWEVKYSLSQRKISKQIFMDRKPELFFDKG